MQNCDKRLRTFIFASMGASLVFSVVRISLIMEHFVTLPTDENHKYTIANNVYTNTFSIALVIMLIVFALFAVLGTKNKLPCNVNCDDSPTIFFSALTGFMGISTAVLFIIRAFANDTSYDSLEYILIVSLFLASVFFFYTASRAPKQVNPLYTVLSFFPVLYSVLRVMAVFMPMRQKAADSTALIRLFGLAFMMLYFVNELKMVNGTGNRKSAVFLGLSTILLNFCFQIPDIFLSAFWLLKFSYDSILTAVDLFITLYIFARLLALSTPPEDNTENSNTVI